MEKRLTVIETAQLLGVSKEAIYNRIRRGTLQTIIENGIKYVILNDEVKKTAQNRKANSNINDAYIQLLKDEMRELKEKNRLLESDKDRLIREKEKLLIESKEKIEQIYRNRDEQLKAILSLATKNTIENKIKSGAIVETYSDKHDAIEADIDIKEEEKTTQDIVESYSDWQDLRDYLKQKGYSKKEKKLIKKKFKNSMVE